MKFKPCPFCGSTDVQFHEDEEQLLENTTTGFIWCHSCGFASDSFYSEETVATLWNRRAQPENKPLTCDGCECRGEYENEVEYGYPSPCTACQRRAIDNYRYKPEEVQGL